MCYLEEAITQLITNKYIAEIHFHTLIGYLQLKSHVTDNSYFKETACYVCLKSYLIMGLLLQGFSMFFVSFHFYVIAQE